MSEAGDGKVKSKEKDKETGDENVLCYSRGEKSDALEVQRMTQ